MADLNTEIRIGADASGVETGVSKAKKSLASLGAAALQAGREAAKGVGSIGEGGDKSARQVESATKSIVSSLQRQIAAFEAGGRGTRAYQESLARIRGVDVSALKPLLDQLDASKAKAQAAATANVQLTSSYAGLSGAALSAGRVLAAIGIGVSVREFIQMADASTNVASRLSLVTDSAAELIAVQKQLFTTAQSSRVSFVDLAQTYSQMSRATKELGVSQNDMLAITKTISQAVTISGGSAQSAQAALIQLSQGFAAGALRGEELNSIMEQTPRLAQAIADGLGVGTGKLREMGKEGELTAENVLGALQKSASGIEAEFARMTPTVVGSITTIANSFLKLVGALDTVSGVTRKLSAAFTAISAAMDFVSGSIDKFKISGPIREATSEVERLQTWADRLKNTTKNGFYGVNTAADLARVNAELAIAKKRLDDLNAAAGGSAAGDQSAYRSRSQSYEAEAARQSKLANDLNNVRLKLSGVPESYVKDMKEIIRLNQAGLLVGKEYTDALKKQQESLDKKGASSAASAINAEQNAYESLISSIRTKIESESLELAGGNALTESQKIRVKLDQELASGKLKLSAAHRAVAAAALEELAVLERQQLVLSSNKAYDAERAKIADEISAAYVTESKAREQGRQSVSDYVQAIEDQNAQTQFEIGLSGKTASAREVAIRQYKIELDLKKQIEAIDRNPGFDETQRIEERTRARTAAAKASATAEASVYVEEFDKAYDSLYSGLSESLQRGFEDGKGFAEGFFDSVKAMSKRLILEFAVKGTMSLVTGGKNDSTLSTLVNGPSGGGITGLANNASSLNSLYSAGSQFLTGGSAGASAASLGYANAIGAVGGDAIGALATANGGWAGVSTGAGALTEAYGAAVAVEAGTAAGAAAGGAAATAGAAGATAGVSAALAAVPVWGWAALAGIAIMGMSDSGGGPKTESGGGITGPNLGGPTNDYAKGLEASYDNLAKTLGLSSTLRAGAFSSQDTQGDSLTQLQVEAEVNGQRVYDRRARLGGYENVGRSNEELQAAMAEEATRVLFSALKASDLASRYKDFLNSVFEGSSASVLDGAISRVTVIKQFDDAIKALPFENLKNLSFSAAEGLLAAAGGLEALSANLAAYYQSFYTSEEQRAQVIKNLFTTLGASGVNTSSLYDPTIAGFRALVEAQDVTTASGQKAYAALLSVSGVFAQLATTSTVAGENLKKALGASISGLTELSRVLKTAAESNSAGLSRSAAQSQISQALATAQAGGGLPTADALSLALNAVSQPSEGLFQTFIDWQRDQIRTANDLQSLASMADDQISIEQKMLDALLGIDKTILTVAEALGAVETEKAATAAQAAQAAAAGLADQQAKAAIAAAQASAAAEAAARAAAEAAARAAAIPPYVTPISYFDPNGGGGSGGSFAIGTNYVPRDMRAQIHEGERIIPAADNRELMARLSSPASGNAELIMEIQALRSEVANLRSAGEDTARSSRKTADTLVNVTRGGNAMLTEAA